MQAKNLAFQCYLFGSAFGGGNCPKKGEAQELSHFLRIFLDLVLGGR